MLVTLHLWAQPTADAPLLHLDRRSEDGLFDRFAGHYDSLWRDASLPLDAAGSAGLDRPPEPSREAAVVEETVVEPPLDRARRPGAGVSADSSRPRRWPGRGA